MFHSSIHFWRFMPKGEKILAQSKRTAPPPISKIYSSDEIFQLIPYFLKKGKKVVFLNLYLKTLLNTKRRILLRGSFVQSKEKHFWNRGRKFQIVKMLLKILFIYLWLFAKELWKEFTKEFAKTKHVAQAWSKMLYKKETIHAYLVSINIG